MTFDSTNTEVTVNISIISDTNDTIPEIDDEFFVYLSFLEEEDPIPGVILEPQNISVFIYEVDGEGKLKSACMLKHSSIAV